MGNNVTRAIQRIQMSGKIYTVRIVHKDFHILSQQCFTTELEAVQQGERMESEYHKVMGNEDNLFFHDIQEHTLIKGGSPKLIPVKKPLKTL